MVRFYCGREMTISRRGDRGRARERGELWMMIMMIIPQRGEQRVLINPMNGHLIAFKS